MGEKSNPQWESHTRDEKLAFKKQQSDARPTHRPVGQSIGERLQEAESAADAERLRCARGGPLVRPTFLGVTGQLDVEATRTVQRVAIEAEIQGGPPL